MIYTRSDKIADLERAQTLIRRVNWDELIELGIKCPECGSHDLYADAFESDDWFIYNSCGRSFLWKVGKDAIEKKYLSIGGTRCPYCDSTFIVGGDIETTSGYGWQRVFCEDCGKAWNDFYQLVGIEED